MAREPVGIERDVERAETAALLGDGGDASGDARTRARGGTRRGATRTAMAVGGACALAAVRVDRGVDAPECDAAGGVATGAGGGVGDASDGSARGGGVDRAVGDDVGGEGAVGVGGGDGGDADADADDGAQSAAVADSQRDV